MCLLLHLAPEVVHNAVTTLVIPHPPPKKPFVISYPRIWRILGSLPFCPDLQADSSCRHVVEHMPQTKDWSRVRMQRETKTGVMGDARFSVWSFSDMLLYPKRKAGRLIGVTWALCVWNTFKPATARSSWLYESPGWWTGEFGSHQYTAMRSSIFRKKTCSQPWHIHLMSYIFYCTVWVSVS